MRSSIKIIWVFGLWFFMCSGLQGCTLLKVNLSPTVSPLSEKVLAGEGEDQVLLIDIEGFISNRKKTTLMGSQVDVGMVERIREILEKASENEDIKALILRINTPGGTVTSSDMIYHEIKEFKKKNKLKVYALVMDLAASGGYYIAQSADTIIAHPTSLIGSIGVIVVKVNLAGLMDKVGVSWEVVKSGDKKDFLSPFRPLTDEERKLFQETIDSFHARFLKTISDNRPKLSGKRLSQIADGRVFTADKAKENDLIDRVAYLEEATEIIKTDLGLKEFSLITYHRSGEYKTNIYSGPSGPQSINLFNMNFNLLPSTPEPHFMYLWMP